MNISNTRWKGEAETSAEGPSTYTHAVTYNGERSIVGLASDGRICLDKRDEQIKSNDL